MEENKYTFPFIGTDYTIRATGEQVEVVAFNQPDFGARSDDDWVTYIDSEGREHIKEHLNIQLDFKVVDKFNDTWKSLINNDWKKDMPSIENSRVFEVAK